MTSADTASIPARGFNRRSRMTTSSWQSMPSTRKTASAWSSQTAQATLAGVAMSRLPASLLDVSQALSKEREHMLIVERIENHPAFAASPDNTGITKEPELVRHRGLGHAQLTGQVADTQLRAGERIEDADTGRVTEDAKDFGQAFDRM